MAQLSYNYTGQPGVPGGLADTSAHTIVARANGEETPGRVKYGYGVVQGEEPGVDVKLPTSASTAAQFEGIVTISGNKQAGFPDGDLTLVQTDTLGILQSGKIRVRVKDGLTITYGEPLYLVNSGDDAGKFSNASADGMAVNGRFIGGVESGDMAKAEISPQFKED